MTADKNNLIERGELLSVGLRENFAARIGDNYLALGIFVRFTQHVTHGTIDGLRLKHHSRAASER